MPLPSVLEELDRLFQQLVHEPWGTSAALEPPELKEVEDGWVLEFRVEGLRAADLVVDVQGRRLTVRGRRRVSERQRQPLGGWSVSEREVAFSRSVTLPVSVVAADVEARLEDSVLKLHVRRPVRP